MVPSPDAPATVLVFGASCQVGHFLLPQLAAAGHEVLAVSRVPRPRVAGVRALVATLPSLPALPRVHGIASFAPLAALAAWLSTLAQAPARKLVATSSMSVVSKRASSVTAERSVAGQLAEGEAAVRRECERLGMPWTLLRPTLIYGAGLDRSLTPLARRAARWRVFPLPAGDGWRQPVHAADVADAVVRSLQRAASDGRVLELGGGERLRARDMFARVRARMPVATLPLPVGRALLRCAAACLPGARGPVSRLDQDLVADNAELVALLDLRPRPFRPDPRQWLRAAAEQVA